MAKEYKSEIRAKITIVIDGVKEKAAIVNKAIKGMQDSAEQLAKSTDTSFKKTERATTQSMRGTSKVLDSTSKEYKAASEWAKKWAKETIKSAGSAAKAIEEFDAAAAGTDLTEFMVKRQALMEEAYGSEWEKVSQKQRNLSNKRRDQQVDDEKAFGARLLNEMERIGVLRGGLEWRFARASGGAAIVVAAAGLIVQKVFAGIAQAVEDTIEMMEKLDRTSGAERAFTNLARTAGISYNSIVADARKASGYTIESYDLITRANKDLRMGYGQLAEAMPELAGLARVMGAAFGEDAAGMLDKLTDSIRDADAATLESEYGFRGVAQALRDEAKAGGVTVDNLDDITAANITLQTVLPQTEQMMRDLGATSSEATANIRETWSELLDYMRLTRGVIVAEGVLLFNAEPGGLTAAADLTEQMLLFQARLKELSKLTRAGTVDADRYAEAWRHIDEVIGEGVLEEVMVTGRGLGLDASQVSQLIQEINDIIAGIDTYEFDPLRIVTPVDFLKGFDKELAKARDDISDLEHEWTVAFAEFMPIEEARYNAEYLGRLLLEKVSDAIRETGAYATAEAEIATNEVLAIVDRFLAEAEAHTTEAMSRIASGMIGAAWKAYTDLTQAQTKEAERIALGLAPYLSLEEVEDFAAAVEKELTDWAKIWAHDPGSLQAQYYRDRALKTARGYADAVKDANKETKASTSSMKKLASAALLANQNLGEWATAFTIEHGGRDPLQVYARHEQPLVAAMIDKLWGEDFKKETGRDPTDADWRAHWYEQWGPLEAWKGGPIGAATGPQAERVKAILKALGIEELGDIYKKDWDKRHGLIAEMDAEMTKIQELNKALGALAGYINSIIPPTEEDPPPPPDPHDEVFTEPDLFPPMIIPQMQQGGITRGAGLAYLHANELVMPLNRLTDMINMRMGARAGGGLNIGTLNIPVTVGGGGGAGVAASVQQAVVGAVRGRAGTEMVRAARRLGH